MLMLQIQIKQMTREQKTPPPSLPPAPRSRKDSSNSALPTSELPRRKIDELYALLVNNDPRGSIPKPNKKSWQEKANLLPTFQAALRRFLAVATTSAAHAPPMLPILFALVTYEGDTIRNLQVEGLPEFFFAYFRPGISVCDRCLSKC